MVYFARDIRADYIHVWVDITEDGQTKSMERPSRVTRILAIYLELALISPAVDDSIFAYTRMEPSVPLAFLHSRLNTQLPSASDLVSLAR
jgi:hypothetical protein